MIIDGRKWGGEGDLWYQQVVLVLEPVSVSSAAVAKLLVAKAMMVMMTRGENMLVFLFLLVANGLFGV